MKREPASAQYALMYSRTEIDITYLQASPHTQYKLCVTLGRSQSECIHITSIYMKMLGNSESLNVLLWSFLMATQKLLCYEVCELFWKIPHEYLQRILPLYNSLEEVLFCNHCKDQKGRFGQMRNYFKNTAVFLTSTGTYFKYI